MRKLFLFTAFFAFLTIQFASTTHAQTTGMVADHFVAEGRIYYEQGKYKQAIDSFSKALLSDPDHEEARELLQKMGVSGSIYLGKDASLEEITRLSKSVAELKARNEQAARETEALQQTVDDLQGQKKGLEEQLDQKREEIVNLNTDLFQMKHTLNAHLSEIQEKSRELDTIEAELVAIDDEAPVVDTEELEQSKEQDEQDIAALQDKIRMIKEEAAEDREEQKDHVKELEKELSRKQTHLAMVNDKLILAKRMLKERYAQLSRKNDTIEELKQSLKEMKDDLQQARLQLRTVERNDTRQQDQLASQNEEQVAVIKKQDEFILELKNKLAETKRELAGLKEKFQVQGAGDPELQAQLEETLRQLDETRLALQEKSEEYGILQQRFEDTRERLELVETLMQDKDAQIENLEKDLNVILEESDGTP